jgi:signal transduction histidine kinase/CheY-like chemotaxis protein
LWQWCLNILFTRTTGVLSTLFCLGVGLVFWHFSHLSSELIKSSALQSAPEYSEILTETRSFYTSDVANRARGHGVAVTPNYKNKPGAIPIPTTFTMVLGERLTAKNTGMKVRLYSGLPFPWRRTTGGAHDKYERDALSYLQNNPGKYFVRFEDVDGRPSIRYSTADIMRPACVNCHNTHPDSPKKDWKVGDVRGVLEIVRPLDKVVAQTNQGLRGTFALLATLGVLGLAALSLVIGKLHRNSTELEQRVLARTEDLSRANAELQSHISERERTQAQLRMAKDEAEEANRTKSQFLASMSHELRTPMNAIIGYSEMLIEEAEDLGQDELEPDLQKIRGAGKHLLSLINDILDLSKIEAGKMDLYLESFDIHNMVNEVASTIAPLVEKNSNILSVRCAEDVGSMHADLTKVRQSLFNLLSNASKFTERGTIDLEAERSTGHSVDGNEWIIFRVRDNGIGMSEEQLEKLFQAFTQADASTTRKYGGTGLGLTITRHFCEMMGGTIVAESQPGQGTTFSITLPAKVVEDGAGANGQEANPPGENGSNGGARDVAGGANTVLVIDDDPTVHDIMRRLLEPEGFRIVTAPNGDEGLRLARALHPAAITLDVMMPGRDGWSVLTEIKADEELAPIPVVMLSMTEDKNLGYALGASDYLIKPIQRGSLLSAMKRHRREATGGTVLIVEDDAEARDLMRRTLQKEGWSVMEAANGRVALQYVTQKAPDLILLDLMMPEMNGCQFVTELRSHVEWRSIPVVVLTAKELTHEDHECLRGAVQDIMQKGTYNRDDLLREMRDLMRQPTMSESGATAESATAESATAESATAESATAESATAESATAESATAESATAENSGIAHDAMTIKDRDAMKPGSEAANLKV